MSEELLTKGYCSHILQCVEKNQQLKDRITGLGTVALVTVPNIDVYFNNSALIAYVNWSQLSNYRQTQFSLL